MTLSRDEVIDRGIERLKECEAPVTQVTRRTSSPPLEDQRGEWFVSAEDTGETKEEMQKWHREHRVKL
jgi:hypothetical protein